MVSRSWWLPALLACSTGGDAPSPGVVDSAGVRIVTIDRPLDQVPTWTIDTTPKVSMASPDSAGFVFVSAAHWLPGNRVLVADARRAGLYVYDATGRHLRTLGREGRGPGEFRGLMTVSVQGDSIGTWDLSQRRFSLFTADGGFQRILATPPDPGAWDVAREAWLLPGQRVLTYWLHADSVGPVPQGVRIRKWPNVAALTITDSAGAVRGRSPSFNGVYSGQSERGDARQLFSNLPFVATTGARVAWGSGERFEVFVADTTLQPRQIVRWAVVDEPLTEDAVQAAREGLRASLPPGAPAARIEEALNAIVASELLPKVRPAISRALFDDAGRLWLGRFEAPIRGLAESYDWVVLDSEGVPVGRVRVPTGTRLEAVSGTDLLVSVRDSLDVQTVQVLTLRTR